MLSFIYLLWLISFFFFFLELHDIQLKVYLLLVSVTFQYNVIHSIFL